MYPLLNRTRGETSFQKPGAETGRIQNQAPRYCWRPPAETACAAGRWARANANTTADHCAAVLFVLLVCTNTAAPTTCAESTRPRQSVYPPPEGPESPAGVCTYLA